MPSITWSASWHSRGSCNMREFASLEDMRACVGQEVAVSDWVEISQQRIG